MPGFGGPARDEPLPLCLRERCPAQRVFANEAAAFEHGLEICQGQSLGPIACALGKLTRQGDNEAEPVLQVPEFHLAYQPSLVQWPERQHEPGEGLDDASFEIVLG